MTETYVFANSSTHENRCFFIEADSEMEALGLLVDRHGMKPVGEMIGTVDEITADQTVTQVV